MYNNYLATVFKNLKVVASNFKENIMAKAKEPRKEDKKKAQKSLKEKRAAKQEKKKAK